MFSILTYINTKGAHCTLFNYWLKINEICPEAGLCVHYTHRILSRIYAWFSYIRYINIYIYISIYPNIQAFQPSFPSQYKYTHSLVYIEYRHTTQDNTPLFCFSRFKQILLVPFAVVIVSWGVWEEKSSSWEYYWRHHWMSH